MKRFFTSAIAFALISSPALSESMREQYKDYSAAQRCFAERGSVIPDYCITGNGKVLSDGELHGKLNHSYSKHEKGFTWIREFYIENGNLIKYECVVDLAKWKCDVPPYKDVYYPTKSRQEVLESKEKFDNYFDSGNAKRKSKNYQGAIADLSKAIEIDPQSAVAFLSRGYAKFGLKDFQGAIADYSKAIEIYPQSAGAFASRSFAKIGLKDFQGANADSSKAIEIDPQNAGAFVSRSVAKIGLKDFQGAIADLSKAIEIDPQNASPFGMRAQAKYLLGDQQGSCPDYKKAVSLGSKVAVQWLNSEKGEWCRNRK